MTLKDLTKEEFVFLIDYLLVDSVEKSKVFIKKYPFKIYNNFVNTILKKLKSCGLVE